MARSVVLARSHDLVDVHMWLIIVNGAQLCRITEQIEVGIGVSLPNIVFPRGKNAVFKVRVFVILGHELYCLQIPEVLVGCTFIFVDEQMA